ncbi:MAG: rhodanese-like domain-containing protein [Clostridium sp.]|nr:rhodanese-like domain-containing protein [Clostridium sp.]
MNDFPMISYKQLDQWLEQGNVRLLADVREPWMYGENRIFGSVNIPYEEVRERLEEFPRQGMIVCYCDRGAKSMVVCRDLWRLGYEVSDLAGGMLDYRGKYIDRRPMWDLK